MNRNNGQNLERMPPQDLEAERALLASVMINNKQFDRVASKITARHFYDRRHTLIWEAMLRQYQSNTPMDQITLASELRTKAQLDEAGGVLYLADLAVLMATGWNIVTYAEVVIEMFQKRTLIELGSNLVASGYDDRYTPIAIRASAERALNKIGEEVDGDPVALTDVLEEAARVYDTRKAAGRDVIGYRTGMQVLDRLTLGLVQTEYTLLAARPSVGKSAFALQLARQVVEANPDVAAAVFSLEMSRLIIAQRLVANKARLPFQMMRLGLLGEEQEVLMTEGFNDLSKLPIYIDDSSALHILELRSRARRLKRKVPNLGLIVVDYLQLLVDDSCENRNQEVSSISRHLKAMAKDLNVSLVALSQLSRQGASVRPALSMLRDSGSLEQDADNVYFLYNDGTTPAETERNERDLPSPETVEFIVAKARNGPTDSVMLNWQKTWMEFTGEQSPVYGDEDAPQAWWQRERDQEVEIGN